jgi:hypothetical protein
MHIEFGINDTLKAILGDSPTIHDLGDEICAQSSGSPGF